MAARSRSLQLPEKARGTDFLLLDSKSHGVVSAVERCCTSLVEPGRTAAARELKTNAPGIILRARELGEEMPEGRAREDILGWMWEAVALTVGAMVPMAS
jgi:hypothetical protein